MYTVQNLCVGSAHEGHSVIVNFCKKVNSCNVFLIIRNSSLRIHFLCSEQKKKRKNKIQKTADIYFVTAGFLIKYSRSGVQSFKQSEGWMFHKYDEQQV